MSAKDKKLLNEKLFAACEKGDEAGVKAALEAGADPSYADEYERTCLIMAAREDQGHPTQQDQGHSTPHHACLTLLLDAGADLTANSWALPL